MIQLSGNNYLSINDNTGLSFLIDISTDNLDGVSNIGFTGDGLINFSLKDGKLFDHENKNIFSYEKNESFTLSGEINNNYYSYYINNTPVFFNGYSNLTKISGFYINTNDSQVNLDLKIYGEKSKYSLLIDDIFYIKSGESLKGVITTLTNFKIYSGIVINPTGFFIESLSSNITDNSVGSILINTYNQAKSQINSESVYPLELKLYTNFGEIYKTFQVTGSYSGYVNVNLNMSDVSYGDETGIGLYRKDQILVSFNIQSGDLKSSPTLLNKSLDLEFSYYLGQLGNINYSVFGSGIRFMNISGSIIGSGYLGATGLSLTGYHEVSGFQVTGTGLGIVNEPFILTGYVSRIIPNAPSTGNWLGNNLLTYQNLEVTGFSSDGVINSSLGQLILSPTIASVERSIQNGFTIFNSRLASNESGSKILISQTDSINANFSTGKVFLYTGSNGSFSLSRIYSGTMGDRSFGDRIYINKTGNAMLIKSIRIGNQGTSGRLYIFQNNNENINLTKIIDVSGQNFGGSIAINTGNIVYAADYSRFNFTGGLDIYEDIGSSFSIKQRFTGYSTSSRFGDSLAITENGKLLAIAAPYANNTGEIYIFTGNNFNYSLSHKINRSGTIASQNSEGPINLSFNKNGSVLAHGALFYGIQNSTGIIYIYTGNETSRYHQTYYYLPTIASQLGVKVNLNNLGDNLFVGAALDNSLYLFTGKNNSWKDIKISTPIPLIDGTEIPTLGNGENIYLALNPAFNTLRVLGSTIFTGYFSGSILASGIVNKSAAYTLTGIIPNQNYQKTFINSFQIETGYYLSGLLTGLSLIVPSINQNYSILNPNIDKNINELHINIKSKNYPDENPIDGKLRLIGRTLDNLKSGVIYQVIQGG